MPRVSVDYLNARKDTAARKGRTIFLDSNALADRRAAFKALDPLEQAILESGCDFGRWIDDLQPFAEMLAGKSHSRGALLAPGESAADLEF